MQRFILNEFVVVYLYLAIIVFAAIRHFGCELKCIPREKSTSHTSL